MNLEVMANEVHIFMFFTYNYSCNQAITGWAYTILQSHSNYECCSIFELTEQHIIYGTSVDSI